MRYIYKILVMLVCLSLSGCSVLNNDKKDWVIEESYKIEKVYPITDIDAIIDTFSNGYRIYQSYEIDGLSYQLNMEELPDSNLSGEVEIVYQGNTEKHEVIFDKGKFKTDSGLLDNCRVFGKFLFQELLLNKEILSKLKIKRWNYDDMTGSYYVEYKIQDPIINAFFGKDENEETVLYVGSISKFEDEYYYSVAIRYGDEISYMERIEEK